MTPQVAVAGMGGFAAEHHAALRAMEAASECRVVATCDPNPPPDRFCLSERGVPLYPSLERMLERHPDLDLVALPTPLPLHAAHHRAAVETGVPCYLEKPPSLWWPEFQAMREVEKGAKRPTQVGFNFVGDPFRRALKARIRDGEFGPLREARLHAAWPRDAAYYTRNDWAGRLRVGDRWVLDSPIGNALAHHVQNLLFWADATGIDEVRAWLGRTRPIESYDTALVEARAGSVTLRIGATHLQTGTNFDRETLLFERATIVFDRWNEARIDRADGATEILRSAIPDQAALLRHNLATYLGGRAVTPLADAAPFVALCDLALVSSAAIHNLDALPDLGAFVEAGRWPFDRPNAVTMDDLPRLSEVVERLERRGATGAGDDRAS